VYQLPKGFDGEVLAIEPANDGSGDVYVGGAFTTYRGTKANRIIRLNHDGSVDAEFASGDGFDDVVHAIAVSPRNPEEVYIAGAFTTYRGLSSQRIVRLNRLGNPAGPTLSTGANGPIFTLLPRPDGSVYVGGAFTSYAGAPTSGLVQLINDDSTVAPTGPEAFGTVYALAFDELARRLIVGGDLTGCRTRGDTVEPAPTVDLCVFTDLNVVSATTDGFSGTKITSLAVIPNEAGVFYAGGDFTHFGGELANKLVRLRSDMPMVREASFNTGSGLDGQPRTLAMARDGSKDLLIGGDFGVYDHVQSGGLLRLTERGNIRNTFSAAGGFFDRDVAGSLGGSRSVRAIAIDPDTDQLYVGGLFQSYNGAGHAQIARLAPDGTADETFTMGSAFNLPTSHAISAPDGSGDVIVVGRFTEYDGTPSRHIIRLDRQGAVVATNPIGFDTPPLRVYSTADGSGDIYVVGGFTTFDGIASRGLVRLAGDLSLVRAAVGGGFFLPGFVTGTVHALAVGNDDATGLYAVGDFSYYGNPLLAANLSQGVIHLDRNTLAILHRAPGTGLDDGVSRPGQARAVAAVTDGSGDIIIGGGFTRYNSSANIRRILRLRADLANIEEVGEVLNGEVTAILPASDGTSIYVGGSFTGMTDHPSPGLMKLSRGFTFQSGLAASASLRDVRALARAPGGGILVAGTFPTYGGQPHRGVLRIDDDFALVDTLGAGLLGTYDGPSYGGSSPGGVADGISVATDGTGDLLITGDFRSYRGTVVDGFARLRSTGQLR